MEYQQIATQLLTATGLVFAGSSFLMSELSGEVKKHFPDNKSREYRKALYVGVAGGFLCMTITVISLSSVLISEASETSYLGIGQDQALYGGVLAFIGSIAFPSLAATWTSLALIFKNRL